MLDFGLLHYLLSSDSEAITLYKCHHSIHYFTKPLIKKTKIVLLLNYLKGNTYLLTDWLTDWLAGWLADWLADWLTYLGNPLLSSKGLGNIWSPVALRIILQVTLVLQSEWSVNKDGLTDYVRGRGWIKNWKLEQSLKTNRCSSNGFS